jgi:hypothetical protein
MPKFAQAEIQSTTEDLSEYKAFLKGLKIGQVVSLPLDKGETSRKVMRALNAAAAESSMRLSRLPSSDDNVRFRVAQPEKRTVNLSPEAKRARAEKARATRASRES